MGTIDARRQSAAALANAIEASSGIPAGKRDAASLGAEIEQALYALNDSTLNRAALREKLLNLKHNAVLADRLVCGELTPAAFARMTSAEMASAERTEEVRELQRENLMQHVTLDGRLPVPPRAGGARRQSLAGDISAIEAMLQAEPEDAQLASEAIEYEDH